MSTGRPCSRYQATRAAQFLVARVRAQAQAALQRGEAQREGDQPEQDRAQAEVACRSGRSAVAGSQKAPCGRPSSRVCSLIALAGRGSGRVAAASPSRSSGAKPARPSSDSRASHAAGSRSAREPSSAPARGARHGGGRPPRASRGGVARGSALRRSARVAPGRARPAAGRADGAGEAGSRQP